METIKQFSETDVFEFKFDFKGEIFDYCPVDGLNKFKTDIYCRSHKCIIDKGNLFLVVSLPNLQNPESTDTNVRIRMIEKSNIWELLNKFNSGRSLYQISGLKLDEECLLMLGGEIVMESNVFTYDDFDKIINNL